MRPPQATELCASGCYVLQRDRARLLVRDRTAPTGVAWSPNGTRFQIADSRAIWVYGYDTERARATCGRRWVVVADGEGQPSGLAIDSEGGVWVAMHGRGRIHRYTHAVSS